MKVYQMIYKNVIINSTTILKYIISKRMAKFDWLKGFDRDPAYVTVNYHGRKIHQSRTGGCISIVFLLSAIFILFFKLYSMFQQDKVIFQTRIGKDSFDKIYLNDMNLSLSVLDSNNTLIPCKNLSSFGLKAVVVFQKFDQNGILVSSTEQQLKPRSQAQLIVENTDLLAVKGRKDVIMPKINVISPDLQPYYEQFSIRIKSLTMQVEPIYPMLKFTNHVINQQKKEITSAIFDDQLRMFKTTQPLVIGQSTIQYTFEIKKVVMITDLTVFPTFVKESLALSGEQKVQSWFYGEEFTTQTYFGGKQAEKSTIFVACFKRSMYTNTYLRHFNKLDTIMAESFGLIGLLSILLFCLYKGYNNWVLERQNIGEQKQVNIIDYYKHQLKSLCIFFANNIKNLLLFFQCYKCMKCIQIKLCCCLFKPRKMQEQKMQEKKKNRLEDELDLYKSRREINYLRKKMKILTDVLSQKFPDLQARLQSQIRLSEHYELTQSLINQSQGSNDIQSFLYDPSIKQRMILS